MLFAEENSDSGSGSSLFSKSSREDLINFPDGIFHISQSIISRFDQNLNQYVQVGQMPVMFARKDGLISLIPIMQNKQMLTKIDCNSNVFWELQNYVYGSTIDFNGTRWLFLFPNMEEAERVTSIVLFEKVKSTNWMKVSDFTLPEGSHFDENEADLMFYDFTQEKITKCEPENDEKEIVIQKMHEEFNNSCSFIYRFNNGHICFAKPIIVSSNEKESNDTQSTEENNEKEENVEDNQNKENEENENNNNNIQKNEPEKVEEKKPKKIRYKTDPVSMKATCDGIDDVKKDIGRLFENLTNELQSLRLEFPSYDNITMNDESVLEMVIRLCEESDSQKKELRESSDIIDQLIYEATAQDAAIEARASATSVLSELDREINRNQRLQKEYQELEEQLASLQQQTKQLVESTIDENDPELLKDEENERMEQEVKELTDKLKSIKEERSSLQEGIDLLTEQNKKADVPVITKDEFIAFEQESREQIEASVLDFAKKASDFMTEQFKDKDKITGQEVIDALSEAWK